MSKRVLFLVINEAEKDPRVFRHARELAARGFDVLCLGWTKAAKSSSLEVEGVKIRNLCSGDISVDPRKFFSRYAGSNEVAGVLAEPVLEELAPDFWQRVRAVARKHAPFLRGPWEVLKKLKNGSGGATDPEMAAAAERESKNDILYMMGINEGMIVASQDINDIDVIVGNDANTLLASAVIKDRTGAGLYYDAHEIFHKQYAEGVRSPFWEDFYRNLESALLGITDCRFTVNRSIADWMAEEYGAEFSVIPNCPSHQEVSNLSPAPPFTVLFHGVFAANRGLEELIEAAAFVRTGEVRFLIRGMGDPKVENRMRRIIGASSLDGRVSIVPPVKMEALIGTAAAADIGVIPYMPVSLNNRFCLPNKIFEYMMAGLALACTDLPELRAVITKHKNGVLFDEVTPKKIAAAIDELVSNRDRLGETKKRSLRAAKDEYNWEKIAPRFAELFNNE